MNENLQNNASENVQPTGSFGNPAMDERELAKRLQFITAAEPLFERYGFKKTTVEDICEAAKASKRTFYELFSDKGDLFIQLLVQLAEVMVGNYRDNIKDVDSAVERLNLYLDAYVTAVTTSPVFRLIMEDPKLIHQMTDGAHNGSIQMEEIVSVFGELVEYGIETGEFRQMNPSIITWIVHALMDGLYLLAMDMHSSDGFISSPEFLEEVRNFVLRGLGVPRQE